MDEIYSNIGIVYTTKPKEHITDDEFEIAIHLANLGKIIIFKQEIVNQKNADALVDDELTEFKTIKRAENFKRAIERDLSQGKKQADNILLFIKQDFVMHDLYHGIETALKYDTHNKIQSIQILFMNGELLRFSRSEILNYSYRNSLK